MSSIAPSPPYGPPDPTVPVHVGRSATASPEGIPTATCERCSTTLFEGMYVRGYRRDGDDVREIAVACAHCRNLLDVPSAESVQYETFEGVLVPNTVFTGFEYLYVDTTAV
jgi:hypothetical protein